MCLVAALAACHIQRITLDNQQLREELEAATGGARGAGDPGHGALRIAAQGSIESLDDAFATASEHDARTDATTAPGPFTPEGPDPCPQWDNGQNETPSITSVPRPTQWAGQGFSTAMVSIGSGKDQVMR
jgi:hypothetical protein